MILIDALYVNIGGGLVLLKYLLKAMKKRQKKFFLLADARCTGMFDNVSQLCYMKASLSGRKRFYRELKEGFSSVFCFGNVPPPIRLNVPVYTYFHNINMLTLNGWPDFRTKILSFVKRKYIKHLRYNTDYWFVQTDNTAMELFRHLERNKSKIKIYPFYGLPKGIELLSNETQRSDYALVGNYNGGAKGHDKLCEAWELLMERGITPRLHLTVSDNNKVFLAKLKQLCDKGVNIVNHGIVSFDETVDIYAQSKAIVYPSINESLGLGLIEAVHAKCDIIASDLPFVWSICEPSAVFDRESAESIAEAVMTYENGGLSKTTLRVDNKIELLIGEITT